MPAGAAPPTIQTGQSVALGASEGRIYIDRGFFPAPRTATVPGRSGVGGGVARQCVLPWPKFDRFARNMAEAAKVLMAGLGLKPGGGAVAVLDRRDDVPAFPCRGMTSIRTENPVSGAPADDLA
ncbi:hypothetical protein Ssi02_44840 [Sinosporangium siamense]|uniref:Uncharacterized protein n=1 Tax=Sinosporangium siamense TaxID=1367973 RepID=A0A919RIG9_9ACTN|nr:hypothetical protein Ssi02_44840 [Sinosporangium siamense]